MNEIYSWKNEKWIPNSKIGADLWDAHYFFGWAVFDAFRTYNHIPHLLHEHINRLINSAILTSIPINYTKDQLINIVYEVINKNKFEKDEEYRFMIFASPGYFKIYDDMGNTNPILTINATTCSRYSKHIYPYLKDGIVSFLQVKLKIT
jgi:branched-chain amino acid aminotransferase